MDAHRLLEGEHGVAGDAVPGLGLAEVEEVEAVELVVLHVPGEPAVEHGHVQHRGGDARHVAGHGAEQRPPGAGRHPHVPLRLPDVGGIGGVGELVGGGEAGAGHVVAVLDAEGPGGAGGPEEGLELEVGGVPGRRGVPRGLELGRLGAERLQGVALPALPHPAAGGAAVPGGEADLLEPRGEGRGGVAIGGGRGGEGGLEAAEGVVLGGPRERGHDLADAVAGRLRLDPEDVGDGVGELRQRRVVLRRHGQRPQPLRRLHRRRLQRHGGGGGGGGGFRQGRRRSRIWEEAIWGNWLGCCCCCCWLSLGARC